MTSPGDQYKHYVSLYHDFTEAYIIAHSLTRDFFPHAKKFIEHTGPEVNNYLDKISEDKSYQSGPFIYQKLVQYINQFDDFALAANQLLGTLKNELHKSDQFMTRLIDLKMSINNTNQHINDNQHLFTALIPELNALTTGLKQITESSALLELRIKKLETGWLKTREQMP